MRTVAFSWLSYAMLTLVLGCGAVDGGLPSAEEESVGESSQALTSSAAFINLADQNQCLAVAAGTNKDGQQVISWRCEDSPSQAWTFDGDPLVGAQLRSGVGADKCLGVREMGRFKSFGSFANGDLGVLRVCSTTNSDDSLKWKKVPMPMYSLGSGSECFRLMPVRDPRRVLGVLGGKPKDGEKAGIWDDFLGTSHLDQVWCTPAR
jgi:hypothetical protein